MYDKIVILFPFLIPPKKNGGRMKGEKSSQTGFQQVFFITEKLFIIISIYLF